MSKVSIIGVDLAKQVFQLHGNDRRGHTVFGKQLKRDQVLAFLATQPACLVWRPAVERTTGRARSRRWGMR